jgi:DNA-binding NarL/FixJ family response regulator
VETITVTPEVQHRVAETVTVLVADDHPALRAGLMGLLRGEPGMHTLAAASTADGLCPTVARLRPRVVVLDYALDRGNGLSACFRLKQLAHPPAVVLYCAYVDPVFLVPARMAQADAMVSKGAPVDELLEAIRASAAGHALLPPMGPDQLEAASSRLEPADLPIAGMLLAGTPVADIAATLGLATGEVRAQALRMIGRMQSGA